MSGNVVQHGPTDTESIYLCKLCEDAGILFSGCLVITCPVCNGESRIIVQEAKLQAYEDRKSDNLSKLRQTYNENKDRFLVKCGTV